MKRRNLFFLLLTLAAGIFLRIYGIGTNYYFSGELGKEMLYLKDLSLNHTLPLIGLPTSHEWLSYGPVYYWIMLPIYSFFNGNPFILFWVALAVSAAGLILNYFVIKKIVGEKIALISTFFASVSPLLIWQTQNSKLHTFFFVLSPLFMYSLYQIWNGKTKWVFWAGLTYGLMFSFHFSQIPLLMVVGLLFYLKKNIYKLRDDVKFFLGVLIPNITLAWQDRNLALWLPYRVINIADKNPAGTLQAFLEYFGRNLFWEHQLWILGLVIFVLVFAHYVYLNRKKITKEFLPFYLISSIGAMLTANVLHGAFPVHYFLPIFTTVPILFAAYASRYKLWYVLVAVVLLINFRGYFAFDKPGDFVSYAKQMAVSDFIIMDAKGKSFSIKRIGQYDYFPENYSQNYKYLILWKGGNLVDNSKNTYTINDYTDAYFK